MCAEYHDTTLALTQYCRMNPEMCMLCSLPHTCLMHGNWAIVPVQAAGRWRLSYQQCSRQPMRKHTQWRKVYDRGCYGAGGS